MPHTSIIYVEFDREQFDIRDFVALIDAVCRLSALKPSDFSVNFPNSNRVFAYTPERIQRYFQRRNVDRNRLEQWKANKERGDKIQKEIEHEMEQGEIAARLAGTGAGGTPGSNSPANFKRLQHPNHLTKLKGADKGGGAGEIPETIKASIRADAQRNRTNHQLTWEDFDKRWAARLHVQANKISSIRKQIYGSR